MSRQLGRLLFLLALWTQFLAPVAAAQIQPGDGPLAGVPICGHAAGDASGADQHQGMPAPFCGLCCAVVAVLDAPQPADVAVALVWTRHVFAVPAEAADAGTKPELPRARDPPALA